MSTPFDTAVAPTSAKPASERSVDYFIDLSLDKAAHEHPEIPEDGARAGISTWIGEGRSQDEISFHIDRLRREGYTGRKYRGNTPESGLAKGADQIPEVPDGRYAIDTTEGAINAVAFYQVDKPTEGRWAGYTFVKLQTGDDEQNLPRQAAQTVLEKIRAVGAKEASLRYGHEIGACGVCGRTLTNDESRERGIGPVCAAKLGW